MFAQITKGLSQNIEQALAKHAPQNLGQNLSHQNLTKPAQNLSNSITQNKANQSLTPQVQTRQALTRFGNELAQNPQSKPTQAVFDFDFIARDKNPELPKSTQAQADNSITPPASAQADSKISPASSAGFPHNSPSRAEGDTGGGLFDMPSTPPKSHTAQSTQNLAPHTPQSQSLQARYDTLRDFASKTSQAQRELTQEAKSLYDSFAKSLEFLNQEHLSAKELNATDRHLSEYLLHSELAQVPSAKDIVLPYFSAKYQAKSEAELAQTFGSDKLAQMRQALQESKNTNPLSEFGTNYAEFYQDGKGAIAKLISEANAAKEAGQDFSGQVAGAFSKEIDGAEASIDLVWGKITNAQTHEGYGLAHITDKHPELDLNLIPQIIERGKVESKNGIHSVILEQEGKEYRIGLGKGWKGNGENEWIITAYENKNIKENGETFYHDTFTTKEPLENLDNEIIQKSAQKIQEKMKVSKEYAQNLANSITQNKANQNLANSKAITLSQKSIQKLATNPRAKAILEKIQAKSSTNNDKIPSQKLATISLKKTQKGQANMQNPHIKILRDNLKQALSPILNTDIINKNTGIVARLSTNGLNKISSSMAVKKSIENGFSRGEHFAVASDLKNLFENAMLLKTHDDYKKKPNIKAIHRYIAQTKINDKDAQALITLKESIQNGHRIYSMELEEVKPL